MKKRCVMVMAVRFEACLLTLIKNCNHVLGDYLLEMRVGSS